MHEIIISGAIGTALKRLPMMAEARKALADDLRRLRRTDPQLAREIALRNASHEALPQRDS